MKLRTHVNLIVAFLGVAFLSLGVLAQLDAMRRAVHEEIFASNIVASQLLGHVAQSYATAESPSLLRYLQSLGRVRANDIELLAADGRDLYRSPPSTYKVGRNAPHWFATLLLPDSLTRTFALADDRRLIVTADASRSILDAWDDIARLLTVGVALLLMFNGLVFWLVNRALAPLPVIAAGLARLRHGELTFRLPTLPGEESRAIGEAFNDMALALEEKVHVERQAREAQARLEERSEFALLIEQRLEEERRMIARELHDEFAQSVTAIRSLANSIAAQTEPSSHASSVGEAAQLISSEAARLYDAMHSLIPRLTPLSLDTLGLGATLQTFVNDWQQRHPALKLSLRQDLSMSLGPTVALTIYRVVQEALINALRHGKPAHVEVTVECDDKLARVRVADDGVGLPMDWSRPGRFGLRGLQDRVANLHGRLQVSNRDTSGVEVIAEIPLESGR